MTPEQTIRATEAETDFENRLADVRRACVHRVRL